MIRQFDGRNLKNISNSCAMINGTAERDPRCRWLTPVACDHELLCFPFVRHAGGRLGDIDRIGAGKAVLEALFERLLELAFASFLALAPRLPRPFRSEFPCKCSLPATVRRHPVTTPGTGWRSPVSPVGCGQYNKTMRIMTCIEDLPRVARRKVPRAFFDYAEARSYAQETLRA